MGRIRTIKPEFPDSESIGRLPREARLLFLLLWTLADDEGRLRGHPKYLAHTLYPYDEDVLPLINNWLRLVESEGCIQRYKFERCDYIAITNWLRHQKIDHPARSRFPAPPSMGQADFNLEPPPDRDLQPTELESARSKRRPPVDKAVDNSVHSR